MHTPMLFVDRSNRYYLLFIYSAGVVDQDYRGNVGVVLFNFSKTDFEGWYRFLKIY